MNNERISAKTCRVLATAIAAIASASSMHAQAAVGRTEGTYSVSSTGAATYQIPLWVSPGAGGVQPSLTLTYNSRGGSGIVGPGWSLSGLSAITRCIKTVAQDTIPSNVTLTYADAFCLDGQRLRLTSGGGLGTYGQAGTTYDTEQATFSLVTAVGASGNGPQSFEVKGKNGLIYEFGNTADSRITSSTSVPTAYMWLVNKVRDRFGNSYIVTYGTGASGSAGIGVPMTISYSPTTAGGSTYINTITFDYGAKATQVAGTNDPATVGYVDGVAVTNTNLLLAVKVNSNGTLMRRYALTYEAAPITVRARLKTITECTSADASNCLLPTNITYNNGASGVSTATTLTLANHRVVARKDINGDGKEDLVLEEMSGVTPINVKVAFSTGTGFGTPVTVHASTLLAFGIGDFLGKGTNDIIVTSGLLGPYTRYSWNGTQFVGTALPLPTTGIYQGQARASDVGGDGRDDLLFDFKPCKTCAFATNLYASTSVNGTVTFAAPIAFSNGPPEMTGSPNAQNQPFDFDGDGRKDWLSTTFNPTTGQRFINVILSRTDHTEGGASKQITGLGYIVGYARINDDSCSDIIAETSIYLSSCNGQAPFVVGFTGTAIGAMDWNSDGRTDVLVQNGANFGVLLSTGTTFAPLLTTSIPVSTQLAQNVFVLDVDGDGQDDVGTWDATGIKLYRHNSPAMPPDLAASITDGYGVGVTLAYASNAARTENSYPNPAYPERDYRGPMILCSSVTATSGASDGSVATFTRSFDYYGARSDVSGRDFLGFIKFRVLDSRNSLDREVLTRTAFPYTGMVYQDDVFQAVGGANISHATFGQGLTDLDATTNNRRVFAFTNTATQVLNEVGGGTLNGTPVKTTTQTITYDSFGNATNTATTVTDSQSSSPQYGQQWTSTIAQTITPNTSNWCLDLPTQTTVTNTAPGTPALTRITSFVNDYPSCRMTQETIEPGDARWQIITGFGFDGFGNVNSITVTPIGQSARTSTIAWSTYAGRFPNSVTQPVTTSLSHTTTIGWDAARGVRTSVTDPNGLQTVWDYDPFGLLTRELRPDGTRTGYALTACDSSNSFCGSPTLRSKLDTILRGPSDNVLRTDTVYRDLFDRPQKTLEQLLATNSSEVTRMFDAFGRLSAQSFPHAPGVASSDTTYTYDLVGRITRLRRPTSATDATDHDTSFNYLGLSVIRTDALGRATTQRFNAVSLITQAIDATGSDTDFEYDAFARPLKTKDVAGNEIVLTYNVRGMKMSSSDPDMGTLQYDYFASGELKSQTDAKSQTVSFTYDYLSRPVTRAELEGTTTWTWGSTAASHNVGKLAGVAAPGYSEAYTYDGSGRLTNRRIDSDATYFYDYTYDAATGGLNTMEYPASTGPSRLKLQYVYESGLLTQVKDANAGTVYWQANILNPLGQITRETLGNGVVTNRSIDLITGRTSSIQSGVGGGTGLQNESYLFDKIGNLIQRQQNQLGLTENFFYDSLYRLDYSTLGGATNLDLAYDAIGNITSRSDVGGGAAWTYHATKKHAVVQAGSNTYSYDANGNVQTRNGFTVNWTSYNYPSEINGSGKKLTFDYGPDRQRYRQVYKNGSLTETTMYIGAALEKVTIGNLTDYRHYIAGVQGTVAIVSRRSDGVNATRYVLRDFIGSVARILNSDGTSFASESFEPYGGRRDSQTWTGPCPCPTLSQIASVSRRGFTDHEMIGGHSMGLIHMNGRVFDSKVGRFMSGDPFVQAPFFSQGTNRYSYLFNNPLSGADPSGFMGPGSEEPGDGGSFGQPDTLPPLFNDPIYPGQQSEFWLAGWSVGMAQEYLLDLNLSIDLSYLEISTEIDLGNIDIPGINLPPRRPPPPVTTPDGTTWQNGLVGPSVQPGSELGASEVIKYKLFAFSGAGGWEAGNNPKFKQWAEQLGAEKYLAGPTVFPQAAAIASAEKFIKENPKGRINIMGYSAGGAESIKFFRALTERGIPVDSIVLFDPHPPRTLGKKTWPVAGSGVEIWNFYQQNDWDLGPNTFRGGRVKADLNCSGCFIVNVNMSFNYLEAWHSNMVSYPYDVHKELIESLLRR
jgi:RHS repeat-associated protein